MLCRTKAQPFERMKKLWTEKEYKRFRAGCQRRSEVRRRRVKVERRGKRSTASRTQQATLTAPQVFSLVEAPDETIRFLNELKRQLPTRHLRIKIDLDKIKRIHPEAVAAFVAIMESTNEGTVVGNTPRDRDCARRLQDFGFFEHVKGGPSHGTPAGAIRMEHTGQKVEGGTAREIIKFGLQRLNSFPLGKHGPSYTIFTEAMTNTFQHAGRRKAGQEQWWAAAYYDADKKAVCFTSVDVGTGILQNLRRRQRSKLRSQQIGWFKQSELDQGEQLRRLLDGKVPSRTGEKYRGRGLPQMKKSCKACRINNLLILSNKAHADVGRDTYRELTNDFRGTIIYWEIANQASEEEK